MARDGLGNFEIPFPDFVGGTTINSSQVDENNAHIVAAIAGSIAADGQTPITADLPMSSHKHTDVDDADERDQYAAAGQVQDEAFIWCGTAGGTADAITLTPTPSIDAYRAGQRFVWIASASPNTGAMTINVSGKGGKDAQNDGAALAAGEHAADKMFIGIYDGTAIQIQRVRLWLSNGFADGAALVDDSGNELLRFQKTASAVNHLDVTNAATGGSPDIAAVGDDTNIDLTLTPKGSGSVNLQDKPLKRPKLIDYGEAINAIGSIGGGTQDIDLTLGNVVSGTVDTSTTTFTFSNPSASGTCCSFTLVLTNGGSQTVNWPASVDWSGAAAPVLTASGVDVLTFFTLDGGTTWYGFLSGIGMG